MYPGPHSRQSQSTNTDQAGHTFSGSQWPHLSSGERPANIPSSPPTLPATDPGPTGPHHPLPEAPVISRALELADSWDEAHPPWEDQMNGAAGAVVS